MPVEVLMPKLGLTMIVGRVARWLVEEGQPVVAGEILFEVENDKALYEIEASTDGVLGRILVPNDVEMPVGSVIGIILVSGETIDDLLDISASQADEEPDRDPVRKVSQTVQPKLLTASYGPALASPSARRLAAETGIDLATIQPSKPGGPISVADVDKVFHGRGLPVKASPAARRAAKKLDVDLTTVQGSGSGGRIMIEDVEAQAASITSIDSTDRIPFSGVRRLIAERMIDSLHHTAQLTLTREVNADSLVAQRADYNAGREADSRISYDAMLVYVVSRALGSHPAMNARLEGEYIIQISSVNIGVAVDTPRGLLVPVVGGADRLDLEAISISLKTLLGKIEQNQVLADDLTGSTFTISNLGGEGIDAFTPILNPPESGILGVGRIRQEVVVDGPTIQFVHQHRMTLSLTFDHRLIDGSPAARFLGTVADFIENGEDF